MITKMRSNVWKKTLVHAYTGEYADATVKFTYIGTKVLYKHLSKAKDGSLTKKSYYYKYFGLFRKQIVGLIQMEPNVRVYGFTEHVNC